MIVTNSLIQLAVGDTSVGSTPAISKLEVVFCAFSTVKIISTVFMQE